MFVAFRNVIPLQSEEPHVASRPLIIAGLSEENDGQTAVEDVIPPTQPERRG